MSLFYVRFYCWSGNYERRFLWTAKDSDKIQELADDFAKDMGFRVEAIRHVCETTEETGMEI